MKHKKTLLISGVTLAIISAIPVSSYITGCKIESIVKNFDKQIKEDNVLKNNIILDKYEKSLFDTNFTYKVKLDKDNYQEIRFELKHGPILPKDEYNKFALAGGYIYGLSDKDDKNDYLKTKKINIGVLYNGDIDLHNLDNSIKAFYKKSDKSFKFDVNGIDFTKTFKLRDASLNFKNKEIEIKIKEIGDDNLFEEIKNTSINNVIDGFKVKNIENKYQIKNDEIISSFEGEVAIKQNSQWKDLTSLKTNYILESKDIGNQNELFNYIKAAFFAPENINQSQEDKIKELALSYFNNLESLGYKGEFELKNKDQKTELKYHLITSKDSKNTQSSTNNLNSDFSAFNNGYGKLELDLNKKQLLDLANYFVSEDEVKLIDEFLEKQILSYELKIKNKKLNPKEITQITNKVKKLKEFKTLTKQLNKKEQERILNWMIKDIVEINHFVPEEMAYLLEKYEDLIFSKYKNINNEQKQQLIDVMYIVFEKMKEEQSKLEEKVKLFKKMKENVYKTLIEIKVKSEEGKYELFINDEKVENEELFLPLLSLYY